MTDTCLSSLIPDLEERRVLGMSVLESYCMMALLGCEYSCVTFFWSKSVSRAVALLIAIESVNFRTVVKESQFANISLVSGVKLLTVLKGADVKC